MAKSMDELAAGGYPAVLPEVCDHEQRIAALEKDAEGIDRNLETALKLIGRLSDLAGQHERRIAALEAQLAQEDAAWFDEAAKRIVACGVRRETK